MDPIQRLKDLCLEVCIQHAMNRMLAEPNKDRRRQKAKVFTDLIQRRSPAQVARMEREMGLR